MELTRPRKNEILQIVEKVGGPTNSIAATRLTTSWLTKPRFFPDAA